MVPQNEPPGSRLVNSGRILLATKHFFLHLQCVMLSALGPGLKWVE